MSYCRLGNDSDAYFICCGGGDGERFFECYVCKLSPPDAPRGGSKRIVGTERALAHLVEHKNAGHKIPQHAIDRLTKELEAEEDIKIGKKMWGM